MATKKTLEEDVTKNPQATTEGDVNGQDTATRLWQSLKNTYGNQMEESDKAYDKAISQQNNAMLARGMQRSSYGASISAGLLNQKNQARNRLGEGLIASYQDRLSQLEEAEAARKFQREERIAGQDFEAEQSALNRAHQTSEREATQKYNTGEREATQRYNTSEREATQIYNAGEAQKNREHESTQNALNRQLQTDLQKMNQDWQGTQNALDRSTQERLQTLSQNFTAQQNALNREHESGENALNRESQAKLQESSQNFQMALQKAQNYFNAEENEKNRNFTTAERLASQDYNAAENEKNRNFTTAERIASQNFTANENAKSLEQSQKQFEIQQAFKEQQWEDQKAQWREERDYDQLSNLQKISMEKVMTILQNGQDPDDTLLGQAGMTRAEANAMKAQAVQVSGGSPSPGNTPEWQTAGYDSAEDMAEAQANGYTNANDWKAYKLLNEGKGIWSGLPGNVQSGGTSQSSSGDTSNRLKNITRRT